MLYPQNGDRIVVMDSVTSRHPLFSGETAGMFLQEALLPQTDRATRYFSQHLVNRIKTSCTTNPQQIAVMDVEGDS